MHHLVFAARTQCTKKLKYRTPAKAIRQAHKFVKRTGNPFTVYKCPHCGKYHVANAKL